MMNINNYTVSLLWRLRGLLRVSAVAMETFDLYL